jgi:hypothetical protein
MRFNPSTRVIELPLIEKVGRRTKLKAVIDDIEIVKPGNPCQVYCKDLLYKVDCDSERIRDFQKQGAK